MKRFYPILMLCLFCALFANSAPTFWIGPLNGYWSDRANWSALPQVSSTRFQTISQDNKVLIQPKKESITITGVYPNPFSESFTLNFYNAAGGKRISLDICDVSGRLLYSYQAGNLAAGKTSLKINLENAHLPGGEVVARKKTIVKS